MKIKRYKEQGKTIEDDLIKLISKGVEKIDIISPLNNKEFLFKWVLEYEIAKGKRILYILSSEEGLDKVKSFINKEYLNYLGNISSKETKGKINLCTYNMALYLNETYDIVIYDEVNSRPHLRKNIEKTIDKLCCSYGTKIAYSFERIFNSDNFLVFLGNGSFQPVVEPRIIQTRVNIEEEIPLNVYEYLLWSIKMGRKIIIYTPSDEKVDKVYDYINGIKDRLTDNIFKKKSGEENRKQVSKFIVASMGIMITNDFKETFQGIYSTNIMLFFADDRSFTYMDLVYISSKINGFFPKDREEVLFVCNVETEDMNKCRDALREINKEAWSQGIFRL